MGYMHIENLYRPDTSVLIFLLRRVYALEKIHGTSAHVAFDGERVTYFSGGEKHTNFLAVFDQEKLAERFREVGHDRITVFGEAYGGKQQGMAKRYGPTLKFVAFDVQVGDTWLSVPHAEEICRRLGLEFVHYVECTTDMADLDRERDAPSVQAKRNGVEGDQPREGVVLRPLQELRTGYGHRIIAKHKRDEERETKTPRKVQSAEALQVLQDAKEIAEEWVTPMRLAHVLDKLQPPAVQMSDTGRVIRAMEEDVLREGAGEFVVSDAAKKEISKATATLFKRHVTTIPPQD